MVAILPVSWAVLLARVGLVFYGVFTPLGVFFRLIGRDALMLKPSPEKPTYWVDRPTAASVRRYFWQF
jgi:hypothetical protein